MKVREIADKLGFDPQHFEVFTMRQNEVKKSGLLKNDIRDEDIPKLVALYEKVLAKKAEIQRADEEKLQRKAIEKREALSSMLITSGFNFDGYRIVKYSGYISGDDAVRIPRTGWFRADNNCQNLTDALARIRIQAIKELKEAAYDLGCNAVIGVDFDYITLEPQTATATGGTLYEPYVICVTANGNAVIIEKD